MLTDLEKQELLKEFPSNLELSYETSIHNKVYNAEYIQAIPEGKKCFAWFTTFRSQNICVLLELGGNRREIQSIKTVQTCFHSHLSYGTIFYGTLFNQRFSIEDVYQYKGEWNKDRTKWEGIGRVKLPDGSLYEGITFNQKPQ